MNRVFKLALLYFILFNFGNESLAEAIRGIRWLGRRGWKREVGYHRRSLDETATFRLKQAFGDRLKSRKLDTQRTESRIRCSILNRFVKLGMPHFKWG